jgi:predicted PurR-regulated permease PerM
MVHSFRLLPFLWGAPLTLVEHPRIYGCPLVSVPVCLATVGFFIIYRLVENYLLIPKIIGGVLKVPALVTVVAVIVGGALLGVAGAVIAIPVAAAVQLLVREMLFPRLDRA